MEITLHEHTLTIRIITLNGRLDAFSVTHLRETQERLLNAGEKFFVVDLSDVSFIDSAGMSALVSLLKRARQANGDVVLVKPSLAAGFRILTLTRFDQVFTLTNTAAEALAQF